MTPLHLAGRIRRLDHNDLNTDYIIASRRKRESLDPAVLRQYLFEEIAPGLAATLQPGDVLVTGKNFGCGSAMEVAVTALTEGAGIRAILAPSFARTYFRNAINNGLLPLICDQGQLAALPDQATITITAAPTGMLIACAATTLTAPPLPPLMQAIFTAGGLAPYFRLHHAFPAG